MWEQGLQPEDAGADRWWSSPLVWVAGAWVAGLLIGRGMGGLWVWGAVGAAFLFTGCILLYWRRSRLAVVATALVVVAAAAAWWELRIGGGAVWGLEAHAVSRLVSVEGLVEDHIYIRTRSKGLMGQFDYRSPSVTFVLAADRVLDSDEWRAMRGRLMVSVPEYDDRLRPGDRVRCTGWLASPDPPANPGERDRQREMRDQGVVGRLSLRTRGNCTIQSRVEETRGAPGDLHDRLTSSAMWSLRHGFDDSAQHLDLLEVLLLGDWRGDLEETRAVFKQSGLTHVLAISGLHLAILMVGAWWGLLTLTGRPQLAAIGGIALVVLYLLIIPPGVAIMRSGLMALVACAALAFGRRVSPMAAMCGAGLALLIWRPQDLLSPGFQLSFTVVAALLLAGRRVVRWMAPMPLIGPVRWRWRLWCWGADYLAVSLIAWCASAPLIAYHFGAVVPAGLLTTLLTLPIVTLLLWLGYLKIIITFLWPELGSLLAAPLGGLGEAMAGCASWAAQWPGAMFEMPRPPPLWAILVLALLASLLSGHLHRWRWPSLVAVSACALWPITPDAADALLPRLQGLAPFTAPPLRLDMLAVGHGSCYLLRSGGRSVVFDCGSSDYLDITTVCVGPALRELGVRRVDTLILSHPDMDHLSGALELVDGFGVRRVVLTRAFIDEAARGPGGAAAYLLEQFRARGVEQVEVAAGWSEPLGSSELRVIWPPAGTVFAKSNDASIVLAVKAAGRRVLLTGDVQEEAMSRMLDNADLAAALPSDVLELPHHGSMVDSAPRFVVAVNPSIVLQSAGTADLRRDAWAGHLSGTARLVTAIDGAVRITIHDDGSIDPLGFRRTPWRAAEDEPYDESWPNVEVNP